MGKSVAVWLIAAGVGVLVLLCGGVTVVGGFLLWGAGRVVESAASDLKVSDKPAKYTRDEFTALVMGKTKDELVKSLGQPDQTSSAGTHEWWYYRGVTRDPASGKNDFHAQLTVVGGRVESVTY